MPVIEVVQKIWVPEIPDIELPYDDGEPLESNWHRLQINLLSDVLDLYWQERMDYFAGGNMFIYYSLTQARNRDYKGPDFFVVQGANRMPQRRSWIVWQEGGRYPDVIVELLSPTTIDEDLGPKKALYEQVFKTFEYFCVNPDGYTLQGWRLDPTRYAPLPPNPQGWLWSESLQLWLGFHDGIFQSASDRWVRFFAPSGALLPTARELADAERVHVEAVQAAVEAERTRAEAAQAAANAAQVAADAERARAEAAQAAADAERTRADSAEAENARLRAELERLRHG